MIVDVFAVGGLWAPLCGAILYMVCGLVKSAIEE